MDYEKKYKGALEVAKMVHRFSSDSAEIQRMEQIFPELKDSNQETMKELIRNLITANSDTPSSKEIYSIYGKSKEQVIDWLEKQGEVKTVDNVEQNPIEEVNGEDYGIDGLWHASRILEKTLGKVEGYQSDDGILDHKAAITAVNKLYKDKTASKEYTFKAIPRLLEMVEPNDRAKSYCQKLIDSLEQEGYAADASIVGECLKQMNDEKVAMATMDLQKSVESSEDDDRIRKAIHDALRYLETDLSWDFIGDIDILDAYAWLERQGEQKPQSKTAIESWKDIRLEVYQQASGNRHEPNYSDDSSKMFSLTDIDEIFEKITEKQGEHANFRSKIQVGDKVTRNEDGVLVNLSQLNRVAKTADKVEPNFKVGDFIINNTSEFIYRVYDVTDKEYQLRRVSDNFHIKAYIESVDKLCHLWTIDDAKDGDVLYEDFMEGFTFIYNGVNEEGAILYSFIINNEGKDVLPYNIGKPNTGLGFIEEHKSDIKPATKEQRDILFAKMNEAGYSWDDKKKELKKIEQEPVDFSNSETWRDIIQLVLENWVGNCVFNSRDVEKIVTKLQDRYGNIETAVWSERDEKKIESCNTVEWKKGDIVSDGINVVIVDGMATYEGKSIIESWYFADTEKFYGPGISKTDLWYTDGFQLASPAERAYLFLRMKEAGYEWDDKNNEIVILDSVLPEPSEHWEFVHEFVTKFGRIPKDEDELNTLVEYVLDKVKYSDWSEDDEHKLNGICSYLNCSDSPEGYTKWIDWLKSLKDRVQPKQEWDEECRVKIQTICGLLHNPSAISLSPEIVDASIQWLKSLKERVIQQPIRDWSKEDEKMNHIIEGALQNTLSIKHIEAMDKKLTDCLEYLKSLKERVIPQQTQNWSEVDEKMLDDACIMLDWYEGSNRWKAQPIIKWLKSLSPQYKVEWSKVNTRIFDDIVEAINQTNWGAMDKQIHISLLKSLRLQSQWKPSEEQIESLEHFVRSIGESGFASPYEDNTKLIYSLIQDLKKLKD